MADPVTASIVAEAAMPTIVSGFSGAALAPTIGAAVAPTIGASALGIAPEFASLAMSGNPMVSALGNGIAGNPFIGTSQIVNGMTSPASNIGGNTLLGSETLGGAWKDITTANDWMNRNQMATQLGMKAASSLMQPNQPMPYAPQGQIHRAQVQPMDYMSLLNPQQSTVLRQQPISLL